MYHNVASFVEGRITGMVLLILIFAIAYYYMKRPESPFIRRVPAIDAIDEGIGRATELGRPVIASPGIAVYGIDYWTVAALSILAHVARLCARNELKLLVPLGGSDQSYTLMEVARDVVENEYRMEGKADDYDVENLPFLSGRQFAWASGYVGLLHRERPGVDIMVGLQWASAMYMSEVAHEVGCMQISGTTYLSNIACLATSSDYVMIGEEMTAAGAYLSEDPIQISSIRTQDIIKAILLVILILGVITISAGNEIVKIILSS